MNPRTARTLRTVRASVPLAGLIAVLALTVRTDGFHRAPERLFAWYGAAWALFAAAAWAVRTVPARHAAALVLAGGVAVAATGLLAPPRTSTDANRYAWDGRVQAAGHSPYDHAPADAALAPLRDAWLFPADVECTGRDLARVPAHGGPARCTRINRPAVHTIYPPVAEGYFRLVHELSPPHARLVPLQVGGALLAVGTTGALITVLRRRGDPRLAASRTAYWAWCPAVPLEAVNNAHIDTLGVLLTVLGLGLVGRRKAASGAAGRAVGGALLGAAVAAKLLPALALPGLLSGALRTGDAPARDRWGAAVRALLPAGAAVALAYLPYLLLSRGSVLGYLPGYLHEEGYEDAAAKSRYALLRLVLPDTWAAPAVALLLAAVVLHVLRRGDPDRPWHGSLLVAGSAFLLLTPGYPWYALLVAALVALDGRWEWLGVPAAGAAAYLSGPAAVPQEVISPVAYGAAAVAVAAGWVLRGRGTGSPPDRRIIPSPAPAWAGRPAETALRQSGGAQASRTGNR